MKTALLAIVALATHIVVGCGPISPVEQDCEDRDRVYICDDNTGKCYCLPSPDSEFSPDYEVDE